MILIDNISQNKTTEYINVAGMNVARIENSTATFLHNDLLGSPVAGTLSNRAIDWREKYTPFGITLVNDSANNDQAGFTGHIKDSDTGLVYMQARYYDPVIGRFYSNDPVGFKPSNVPSFGRYTYGNNNPYKYVDPDGNEAESFFIQGKTYENFGQAVSGAWGDLKQSLDRDVQAGAQKVNEGIEAGGELAINNLGTASTVIGVLPEGQVHSIALGVADALVNGDTSSTSSAVTGTLTEAMLTDIATDAGKQALTGKAKAIITGVSQVAGYLAGEADKKNSEKQLVKPEEKKE